MMRRSSWVLGLALLLATPALAQEEAATPETNAAAESKVHCKMTFDISGWAFFYRTADGTGVVTCSNGETYDVVLEQRGFGLAAGSGEVKDGSGVFSPVAKSEEILGTYGGSSAVAGAGKGDAAAGYTKGSVSLAVSGRGDIKALGVGGGSLTIKRAEAPPPVASH